MARKVVLKAARLARRLQGEGLTKAEIARALHEKGFGGHGGKPYHSGSITRLLTYAGPALRKTKVQKDVVVKSEQKVENLKVASAIDILNSKNINVKDRIRLTSLILGL